MGNNFFKYLNTGPIEEKWGIYVTTVGYSKVTANERYPKEEHPPSHQLTWNRGRILTDYYMIFISKGKGTFCSALTEPVEIEEGACFFLFPGVWHRYRPDIRSGWEEYWVGFHGYYVDQLMKQGFFDPNQPCIKTGLDRDMLVLFKKMIDVVNASHVGYSQQIAGLTLQMLGLVNTISLSKQYDHSPLEKAITKAKFLLQESLEHPVDIPELARQLHVGYSAFRRYFKAVTGLSPNQYHLNLRIERAKELLESTLLNVGEIADQTGFDNIYYFSGIFKKKVGLSPITYRKTFAVE